jgi:hypothetical protein
VGADPRFVLELETEPMVMFVHKTVVVAPISDKLAPNAPKPQRGTDGRARNF